jgi:hypothetical protein
VSDAAIWRRLIEKISTLPTRPQNEVATQREAAAYIRGFNACRDEALAALRACPEALAPSPQGVDLIAAERARQQRVEGWTPAHDDTHDKGEMLDAAACYAAVVKFPALIRRGSPSTWPWALSWWKPSDDPIRNLVKAGALIAAEIDRLQRVAEKASR